MSQIEKRAIASDAVDGTKIKLLNAQKLRARNNANNADVDLFDLNASNEWTFYVLPKFGGSNVATESYVGTQLSNYIPSSEKGTASGVATLDGSGKVPVSQLPNSIMEYKGNWDASTNTPPLSDGSGDAGDVYKVSVSGTRNFGSGSISFDAGDYAIYNGSEWEKSDSTDISSTDALTEGSTNLYFTNARARTASVVNSTAGNETDQAPSVFAVKALVDESSSVAVPFTATLTGADITNGYVDLPALADRIISVTPKGFPAQHPVDDFTTSTVLGVTRITFAGDMLLLQSGDKIAVVYSV